MIAVVDYGLGNLASVRNAFRRVGAEVEVTADPNVIERAEGVVLPGVGAASAGMERMQARGLDRVVRDVAEAGKPVLGLCLGMQLLFERSEEGDAECLGLMPGVVERIRGDVKVPHIGWNEVVRQGDSDLLAGLPASPYFYYVHSYVCRPSDESVVAGTTDYGEPFCSAVARDRVWGTQFHPERSGQTGLQLIANFVRMSRESGVGPPIPALEKRM